MYYFGERIQPLSRTLACGKDEYAYYGGAAAAYSRISSVIRCELSIRLRSANKESAAEDLYALPSVKTWDMRATKRELHTLYHFVLQSISSLVREHAVYLPGMLRVSSK
jgi:hypothetical protein